MKKIIHHIRRQPEKVRRHILHVLTISFGVVLLLLWVYSLGTSLTSSDIQTKVENDIKPFVTLKDNLIGGYKSLNTGN